jgi:hypothetical protein
MRRVVTAAIMAALLLWPQAAPRAEGYADAGLPFSADDGGNAGYAAVTDLGQGTGSGWQGEGTELAAQAGAAAAEEDAADAGDGGKWYAEVPVEEPAVDMGVGPEESASSDAANIYDLVQDGNKSYEQRQKIFKRQREAEERKAKLEAQRKAADEKRKRAWELQKIKRRLPGGEEYGAEDTGEETPVDEYADDTDETAAGEDYSGEGDNAEGSN